MKSPLVLTVLLSLLVAKLCHAYCVESQEQQMPSGIQTKKSSDPYKMSPSLLRRLYDGQGISYEALLRLSGKEEVNPQALASSQKRDMHDFFVGLMGKRTTEPESNYLLGLMVEGQYSGLNLRWTCLSECMKVDYTAVEKVNHDNPTEINKGTLTGFGDPKYSPNAE